MAQMLAQKAIVRVALGRHNRQRSTGILFCHNCADVRSGARRREPVESEGRQPGRTSRAGAERADSLPNLCNGRSLWGGPSLWKELDGASERGRDESGNVEDGAGLESPATAERVGCVGMEGRGALQGCVEAKTLSLRVRGMLTSRVGWMLTSAAERSGKAAAKRPGTTRAGCWTQGLQHLTHNAYPKYRHLLIRGIVVSLRV